MLAHQPKLNGLEISLKKESHMKRCYKHRLSPTTRDRPLYFLKRLVDYYFGAVKKKKRSTKMPNQEMCTQNRFQPHCVHSSNNTINNKTQIMELNRTVMLK